MSCCGRRWIMSSPFPRVRRIWCRSMAWPVRRPKRTLTSYEPAGIAPWSRCHIVRLDGFSSSSGPEVHETCMWCTGTSVMSCHVALPFRCLVPFTKSSPRKARRGTKEFCVTSWIRVLPRCTTSSPAPCRLHTLLLLTHHPPGCDGQVVFPGGP